MDYRFKKFSISMFFFLATLYVSAQDSIMVETIQETTIEVVEKPKVIYPATGFSIGANIGMPMFWGDFKTFSADKNYFGILGGLQARYQMNNLIGYTLSFDIGTGRTGAREYSKDYLLNTSGNQAFNAGAGVKKYGDLHSQITFMSIGAQADFNIVPLLGINQPFAIELSPVIYLQKFSPKVSDRNNGDEFTDGSLKNNWNIGLGAEIGFRHDLTQNMDYQIKTGPIWVTDNNFDGIATAKSIKQNMMWQVKFGVNFKLN